MEPPPDAEPGPIRFADVLTTASAAAHYLGSSTVSASHLLQAIQILQGALRIEDLGRPLSPLVRRGAGSGGVDPAVQSLVQRWFLELGDVHAELQDDELDRLAAELREISA